ncbi:ATP phosphoribosyltransferase regulatory subunit [Enterovirga sp. CN4-39]|uniref:ATP phosphoribosyltransferase regulatory subunit n=1 Tax=Enterovirga sp. CN4-39 TaxID=3400910 RepID=UPI003BFC803A
MTPPLPTHDDLVALFTKNGAALAETSILQPAGLFLELSGENIRRRLFITQDEEGREFCLRPEHTIPVCLDHVRSGRATGEYCYLGPVFRQRAGEPSEFVQAGIESIGRMDAPAADAAVFGHAMEALGLFGNRGYEIMTGDMGLLHAVLDALAVPAPVRRRLVRHLAAGRGIETALAEEPRPAASDYDGLLAAIEGQDPRAAKAFVEDVISIAGISAVGGRSAGEIAERFLSRAANRSAGLTDASRDVLRRYLGIQCDLAASPGAIRTLASEEGLAIEPALARYEERLAKMEAAAIAAQGALFAADFVRNMDYYTGFIFEVREPGSPPGRFVIGGGRYDRLLEQLGSPAPVPAVGCSFWLDRLGGGAR